MDYLLYDLVEEIVCYLPRKDVEVISRVAARSQELKNWSAASEDQLENRFLLDVEATVEKWPDEKQPRLPGHLTSPKINLSARKILPDGSIEAWNFKQWRFAWIRNLRIGTTFFMASRVANDPGVLTDTEQAFRTVSLPIDPSAGGELVVSGRGFCHGMADCCSNILQVVSKDFARVRAVVPKRLVDDFPEDVLEFDAFNNFVVDYLESGPLLEDLLYENGCCAEKVWRAIALVFGRRRGTPLEIKLVNIGFLQSAIRRIVKHWWNSDGAFEKKKVMAQPLSSEVSAWLASQNSYNFMRKRKNVGYIAHRTKRSSLYITKESISVVEFRPWHTPVGYKWIDSVIKKWTKRNGRFVYDEEQQFYFYFNSKGAWSKLVKKYGPLRKKSERRIEYVRPVSIVIAHPSNAVLLEVIKKDLLFNIRVKTT
uniref:F-box domain-containing protein n=1 Tax=Steinernema glaseri TaxID=37863 RepID=A0A1I7YVC0_9BILA